MKKTRKFAAMVAAMAIAACSVAPAMAYAATSTNNSITITNDDTATHTYAAYQIFSGNFSGKTLNDIDWGDGVNRANLLSDLQTASNDTSSPLSGLFPSSVDTAAEVAEVLGSKTTGDTPTAVFGNDSDKAQAFAAIVAANVTSTTSGNVSGNVISDLPDGYYLIMDTAAPTNGTNNSGAKTRYVVKVSGDTDIEVAAKHAAPTVDKQVQDETGDAEAGSTDGWGETADHAINETFQFKLTATLTADPDYAAYNTYRLLFTDTLNAGVTFDGVTNVTVNGNAVNDNTSDTSGYLVNTTNINANGGGSFTVSIGDIKHWLPQNVTLGSDVVTVEVIYKAHLNENAAVENTSQSNIGKTYKNMNGVKLSYSNNPNVKGTGNSSDTPGSDDNKEEFGETPEDYVWVFTYEVDNTKYKDEVEKGNELAGAGFTLYSDSTKTTAIKLVDNANGTYTVADQSATSGVVTEMTSFTGTGIFNIKGLDAGTYYLSETNVPAGYNQCPDITITISSAHQEDTGGATASFDLTDSEKMTNNIVNKPGSELPSTGGMGTKLFIAGGGLTATLAAVYLVSKKRSREE